MKEISRIFILLIIVSSLCSPFMRVTSASSFFTDVSEEDWFSEAVLELYRLEVISGTGNGRFEPKDTVTKAQAAAFFAKAFQLNIDQDFRESFIDVSRDSWYFPYVEASVSAGLFHSDERYFSPETPITRGELVALLLTATNILVDEKATSHFQDISGHKYEQQINTAFQLHITNGVTVTQFAPDSYVTRAELASFLYRDHIFAKIIAARDTSQDEFTIKQVEAATEQVSYLATEPSLQFFLNGKEHSVQELKKAGYIVQFVASTDVFQSAIGTRSTTGILSEKKLRTIFQKPLSERYFYYQVMITKEDVTVQSNVQKVSVIDHHRLAKTITHFHVQRGDDITLNSNVLVTGEVYQITDIEAILMNDLQVKHLPQYVEQIEYSSSNSNVALVSSEGQIMPLTNGSVTITVISGNASYSRSFVVKNSKRKPAMLDSQVETLSLSATDQPRTISLTLFDQYGDPMHPINPTGIFSVQTLGTGDVTVMIDEATDINGEFHLRIIPHENSSGAGSIVISFKDETNVAMKIAFYITKDLEPISYKLQIVSTEKQLDRHKDHSLTLRLQGLNDFGAYIGDMPLDEYTIKSSNTELVQVTKHEQDLVVSLGTNEYLTGSAFVSVWEGTAKIAEIEVNVIDSKPRIHQIDFADIAISSLYNKPLVIEREIIKAFILTNGHAVTYEWIASDTLHVISEGEQIATMKLISNVLDKNKRESIAQFVVRENGEIVLQQASTQDGRFQIGDFGEIYLLVYPIRETEATFMNVIPVHIL